MHLTEIYPIALTIITPTTFTALLLMAVGSTMLTKPFASPLIAKLGARVKAAA